MKVKQFVGRRVIKTGLAVFLTAWICHIVHIPAMFAVITAIVTTEPTAADSLKKGLIRLPAAAVGAAIALVFDFVLGPSALTYSLVAMITIVLCYRLQFDTGTLVATLTAVAMIPGTSESLIIDFATRVSGTSIGIIVSTLVNFLVLPPKFAPIIYFKVDHLYDQSADMLEQNLCHIEEDVSPEHIANYRKLNEEINKTFQLIHFQEDEWRYRRYKTHEKRSFQFIQKKHDFLQKIIFHLGNLCYLHVPNHSFTTEEKLLLKQSMTSISSILKDPLHRIPTTHVELMKNLCDVLQTEEKPIDKRSLTFQSHSIVLYELLALHEIIQELENVTSTERKFSFHHHEYPNYLFLKRFQYD